MTDTRRGLTGLDSSAEALLLAHLWARPNTCEICRWCMPLQDRPEGAAHLLGESFPDLSPDSDPATAAVAHSLVVDHLSHWVPELLRAVERKTSHAFYRRLAATTVDWLSTVRARLATG